MANNPFQDAQPNVNRIGSQHRVAYDSLVSLAKGADREGEIVLPAGCSKSECIMLAPFAFRSVRTLVVAQGVRAAQQLYNDFDPTRACMFYIKRGVLDGPYPEPVHVRGTSANRADLDESRVVITNIQQLQGADNRWLSDLPVDYFDLILFDESRRIIAKTCANVRAKFASARIVIFSAADR